MFGVIGHEAPDDCVLLDGGGGGVPGLQNNHLSHDYLHVFPWHLDPLRITCDSSETAIDGTYPGDQRAGSATVLDF